MNDLTYNHVIKDKYIIVYLKGDLDAYKSEKIKDDLKKIINENKEQTLVVLNLSELNYIDSAGLGSLVSILRYMKEQQKKLTIYKLNKNIERIFKMTRLDSLFGLYNDLNDVLEDHNLI